MISTTMLLWVLAGFGLVGIVGVAVLAGAAISLTPNFIATWED